MNGPNVRKEKKTLTQDFSFHKLFYDFLITKGGGAKGAAGGLRKMTGKGGRKTRGVWDGRQILKTWTVDNFGIIAPIGYVLKPQI